MARRSSPSRGSAFGRGRSPSPSASRRAAPPPPPKAVAPQPKQPAQVGQAQAQAPGGGMLGQIASTAAGVAIGSTVGHVLTGAIMGGGKEAEPAVQQQEIQQQQPSAANRQQDPCRYELEQFLSCAQNQSDLSFCDGFNQVLRECKTRYGGERMYQ